MENQKKMGIHMDPALWEVRLGYDDVTRGSSIVPSQTVAMDPQGRVNLTAMDNPCLFIRKSSINGSFSIAMGFIILNCLENTDMTLTKVQTITRKLAISHIEYPSYEPQH